MNQSYIMSYRMIVCIECKYGEDNILTGDYYCRASDDEIEDCVYDAIAEQDYMDER